MQIIVTILLLLTISMSSFADCCSTMEKYNVINDPQLSLLLERGEDQGLDSKIAKPSQYQLVLNTVSADIASTYIALRKTQRLTDLSRKTVANLQQRHKLFDAQHYQGPGTSVETDIAESKLTIAQAGVISLEAQSRKLIYRLSVLIGECPDYLLEELSCPTSISLIPNDVCYEEICGACQCLSRCCGAFSQKSLLYRKIELKLQEELFSSYDSYCSELERHVLLLKSIETAQKAARNAQDLFLSGGSLLMSLNAEQALIEAQIALVENEAELSLKAVTIQKFLGECW